MVDVIATALWLFAAIVWSALIGAMLGARLPHWRPIRWPWSRWMERRRFERQYAGLSDAERERIADAFEAVSRCAAQFGTSAAQASAAVAAFGAVVAAFARPPVDRDPPAV